MAKQGQIDPLMAGFETNEHWRATFNRIFAQLQADGVVLRAHREPLDPVSDEPILVNLQHAALIATELEKVEVAISQGATNADSLRQAARMKLIGALWCENRWNGAWQALVEAEFPGQPLTAADTRKLEARRRSYLRTKSALMESYVTWIFRTDVILQQHRYPYSSRDRMIAMYLVSERENQYHRNHQPFERLDLERVVRRFAQDPTHPAWAHVIDQILKL